LDTKTFIEKFQSALVDHCVEWAEYEDEPTDEAEEFARNIVVDLAKDEKMLNKIVELSEKYHKEGRPVGGVNDFSDVDAYAVFDAVNVRDRYFRMNHSVVVDIPEDNHNRDVIVAMLCELLQHGTELWTYTYGMDNSLPWMATTVALGEIEFDDVPDFGPYAIDLSDGIPDEAVEALRSITSRQLAIVLAGDDSPNNQLTVEVRSLCKMVNLSNFARLRKLHNDDFEGTVYYITGLAREYGSAELIKLARMVDFWHTWFVYMDPANQ
jgi:hypothetical protein